MKVLMINLDKAVFSENSPSRQRLGEYSNLLEKLYVITWTTKKESVLKSERLAIYPTNSRFRLFYFLDTLKLAERIMAEEKIDLIVTQDPFETGFAGCLLAAKHKILLQIQVHADFLSPFFGRESFGNKARVLMAKFLLARADSLRVVSERIKLQLLKTFKNRLKTEPTILPIFIDAKKYELAPVIIDLKRKYPQFTSRILVISRLSREKNISLAIEAMVDLVKELPGVGMIIVGQGAEKEKLLGKVNSLGLQNNIIFEPWTDDPASYYKSADLFLLTSNYEGWGLAVLEAMACGCPVVMTDVGCAGEIVRQGENGIIVSVGDARAVAAAALKLLTDEKMAAAISQAARRSVGRLNDKEKYLIDLKATWERAVSRKKLSGVKLLILTQKLDLNDDVLGFMHGWVEEFSRQCEKVLVICLEQGRTELPANVKVLSLGKEKKNFQFSPLSQCEAGQAIFPAQAGPRLGGGNFQLKRIVYLYKFYSYIFKERNNYEAVLVHMNEQYVILGWPLWKLIGKKIGLWYAHRHVPFTLRLAEKLTDYIFTSTKSGFRLNSKKVKVIGQGIDVEKFRITARQPADELLIKNKIISVGRISPSKDYGTLIKAVEIIKNKGLKIKVQIIGGPATEADKEYFQELKRLVAEKKLLNEIEFSGPVANKDIAKFLASSSLFVNMGRTGSLDKAIVEAMASGLPVLTCNEALLEVLGEYKNILMYDQGDDEKLAEKIIWLNSLPEEKLKKIGEDLRQIVVRDHSLKRLISKILSAYEQKN